MIKDENGSLLSTLMNNADMHLSSPPTVLLAQATVVFIKMDEQYYIDISISNAA